MKILFFIAYLLLTSHINYAQLTNGNKYKAKIPIPIDKSFMVYIAPNKIVTAKKREAFNHDVNYKLYAQKRLVSNDIKGVVLLSNYNAALEVTLLNDIAQQLANANYIVAIIQHHANQGNVKDNTTWQTEVNKIDNDYQNVWSHIQGQYGNISKAKLIVGGVSFTGFALGALALNNTWYNSLKGIALIAAGCNAYVPIPVINRVCNNDLDVDANGNKGGQNLRNAFLASNTAIAAKSVCVTDPICTGHYTSDTWASFFVTQIKKWLP